MAMIFTDGFDKYGPVGQVTPSVLSLLTAGEWSTFVNAGTSSLTIVAGLSALGQALSISTSGNSGVSILNKTLPNSYSRLIGGIRFSTPLTSTTAAQGGVQFSDGSTAQCTITVNASTGLISLRTGGATGTALATSTTSVAANSTHYLEWDITFGLSASYQVWLDGVSLFSGTGATRSSTNNTANILGAVGPGGAGGPMALDDLYLFDSTGATCNAVLLNNPIVETSLVNADAQTQWANGGSIIGLDYSANAITNAPGVNQLFIRTFTPPVNMTLNSVSCVPRATSATAKFKPIVYGPVPATGAHRYWRILVNATAGNANLLLAEVQFRAVAGTPQLFSGGTVSANAGTPASAIDNNPATNWGPGGSSNLWLQYDYGVGNTFTVAEVMLQAPAGGVTGSPINLDLQFSDDGSTWMEAANFLPSWSAGGQVLLFPLASRPTSPGSPGSTLIATGNEVVGTISGTTLTASFTSGQSLTAGTPCAIGFITDTGVVLQLVDTASLGLSVVNTYSAGAPTTLPSMTSGASWQVWGNCTGAAVNWVSLTSNPPVDDLAFISSSTVNDEYLASFAPLSNTPASVACVAFKARTKRSDTGVRTVDVRAVSSGHDTAGSAFGFTPATSFSWLDTYFPIDPNTGVAWTGSAINAVTGGVRVAS